MMRITRTFAALVFATMIAGGSATAAPNSNGFGNGMGNGFGQGFHNGGTLQGFGNGTGQGFGNGGTFQGPGPQGASEGSAAAAQPAPGRYETFRVIGIELPR